MSSTRRCAAPATPVSGEDGRGIFEKCSSKTKKKTSGGRPIECVLVIHLVLVPLPCSPGFRDEGTRSPTDAGAQASHGVQRREHAPPALSNHSSGADTRRLALQSRVIHASTSKANPCLPSCDCCCREAAVVLSGVWRSTMGPAPSPRKESWAPTVTGWTRQ